MATFSYTINVPTPEIDTSMKLDVSISAPRSLFLKINSFIDETRRHLNSGAPYPDGFEFLQYVDGGNCPFWRIEPKTVIEKIELDDVADCITFLTAICANFPEIKLVGKIYQRTPMLGHRVVNNLRYRPYSTKFEVNQEYAEDRPGVTYVDPPERVGNSTSESAGKPRKPVPTRQKETPINLSTFLLPNGKANAFAILSSISVGALVPVQSSFGDTPSLWRYEFSANCEELVPGITKALKELGQALFDFDKLLGKDTQCVDADAVSPQLFGTCLLKLRDVTPFYLLGLFVNGAVRLVSASTDTIKVLVDERLPPAIPEFETLLVRLLWAAQVSSGIDPGFTLELGFTQSEVQGLDGLPPARSLDPIRRTYREEPVVAAYPYGRDEFDGGLSRRCEGGELPEHARALNDEDLFVKRAEDVIANPPATLTVFDGLWEGKYSAERGTVLDGDAITLVAVWNTRLHRIDYADVVQIGAYDQNGTLLGFVEEPTPIWKKPAPDDFAYRELACLLPYVTAVAKGVSGENHTLTLALSYDFARFKREFLVERALGVMRRPRRARALLSKGELVASQIPVERMGFIAKSLPIEDVYNPADRTPCGSSEARVSLYENILCLVGADSDFDSISRHLVDGVLEDIERTEDGHYYDPDELGAADTAFKRIAVIRKDAQDHLCGVFSPECRGVLAKDKAGLLLDEQNGVLCLVVAFRTSGRFEVEKYGVFLGKAEGKLGVAVLSKPAYGEKALVCSGNLGEEPLGEIAASAAEHSRDWFLNQREELANYGRESGDRGKTALRLALMEAFGWNEQFDGVNWSVGASAHPAFSDRGWRADRLSLQPEEAQKMRLLRRLVTLLASRAGSGASFDSDKSRLRLELLDVLRARVEAQADEALQLPEEAQKKFWRERLVTLLANRAASEGPSDFDKGRLLSELLGVLRVRAEKSQQLCSERPAAPEVPKPAVEEYRQGLLDYMEEGEGGEEEHTLPVEVSSVKNEGNPVEVLSSDVEQEAVAPDVGASAGQPSVSPSLWEAWQAAQSSGSPHGQGASSPRGSERRTGSKRKIVTVVLLVLACVAVPFCVMTAMHQMECEKKYGYVLGHESHDDRTTYEYLSELSSEGYKDAKLLYSDLYGWHLDFDIIVRNNWDWNSTTETWRRVAPELIQGLFVRYTTSGGVPGTGADLYFDVLARDAKTGEWRSVTGQSSIYISAGSSEAKSVYLCRGSDIDGIRVTPFILSYDEGGMLVKTEFDTKELYCK